MLIEEDGTLKCVEEIMWNLAWIHSLTEGRTIDSGQPADGAFLRSMLRSIGNSPNYGRLQLVPYAGKSECRPFYAAQLPLRLLAAFLLSRDSSLCIEFEIRSKPCHRQRSSKRSYVDRRDNRINHHARDEEV
jgi:hypothetical protein